MECSALDDLVREEDLRAALQTAGERVGLGGWRPEYGRFMVAEWAMRSQPSGAERS